MKDQSFNMQPDIRELYAFLYASLPEVGQEPVAYAWKYESNFMKVSLTKQNNDWIPLYTHPQPKRERITDKEISDLYNSLPLDTREDVCSFSYKLGFKKAMELLNA
jgi:hypothetical protein